MSKANNYGVESNMPPANPSKRVDILDIEDVIATCAEKGKDRAVYCRCYRSEKFPFCDGAHNKHNVETGDNTGPCVLLHPTSEMSPNIQDFETFAAHVEEELNRESTGPRADNYGIESNMPPDNPSKRVDFIHLQMIKERIEETGKPVALCRCYKSAKFPFCDGAHNSHNEETGDNAGPLVLKIFEEKKEEEDDDGSGLPIVSLAELSTHNKMDDFWVAIHGKVYDLTEFLPDHPGGVAILKQFGGKVADQGFDPIHPESIISENSPPAKVVGRLSKEEAAAASVDEEKVERPSIDSILNLYDLREVAEAAMKSSSWGYYFTGSTDEFTKFGNQMIFRRIKLAPRVMVDVSNVNMETEMLGYRSSFPVYISGAAKGGLAHLDAEAALARAAYIHEIIQMCPHMGSKTFEEMAAARGDGQVQFLQIYTEKDREATRVTFQLANDLDFKAFFITVDSAGIGKRERDLRMTPGGSAPRSKATKRRWADNLTWDDIPFFRELTNSPIILKGIQTGADAILAYEHGVEGIVVSNHGGRNLDTSRPTLEVLVEVMDALRSINYEPERFEVYLDGGIMRGTDIFKALALGAKCVGIGRAALFGLAAYGQEGVEKTLEILRDELYTTMMFMGTPTLADIQGNMIRGVQAACDAAVWDITRDHLPALQF